MKNCLTLIFACLTTGTVLSQDLSGEELLDKAIAYHDPQGHWSQLSAQFSFAQDNPTKGTYSRVVSIDNAVGAFAFHQQDDEKTIDFALDADQCKIKLNGKTEYTEEEAKKYRLSCERVKMYRDYYTYLYGLPMKLKDEGTIIDSKVREQAFDGKSYFVLRVTYDEAVGSDIWYFYFDKETYALSGYRFYHDESANDGEYITLSRELEYQGIKIPKTRKWYYNKDNKYLGTDDLQSIEAIK